MPITDKQLLIDADRIVYAVGFACEKTVYQIDGHNFTKKKELKEYLEANPLIVPEMVAEVKSIDPIANCLHSVKMVLDNITGITSSNCHVFIGGKGNFRLGIDPLYKANRINNQKPYYYHDIRDYMVKFWGAEVVEGMEADDIVAMLQTDDTVIVSGDKDLLQVTGSHYNPTKPEQGIVYVDETAAAYNFYVQLLAGDATDNIKGLGAVPECFVEQCELHHAALKGCGLVSAQGLLKDCNTPTEMHQRVLDVYKAKHDGDEDEAFKDFLKQGQLLYLCRDLEPETGLPVPWDGSPFPDGKAIAA